MKIDLESQMIVAARDGTREYQPVCRNLSLKVETGVPANSEANLKLLLNEGLVVAAIHVVNGTPVFIFRSGETYLATGFGVGLGARDPKCVAFSRIAAKVLGGTTEEWLPAIAEHWPTNFNGPIVAADRPTGLKPRLFDAE